VGFDEFDVESWKNCDIAFKKTVGRMRGCENPQMFFVSTPEGTHYLHKIFVEDDKGDRKLFRAKTSDNPFLPDGYVDSLEANYDDKLLSAYRDGLFVNLTSGVVYHAFGAHNIRPVELDARLPIVIMCDFNRGVKPMCWNIGQEQSGAMHIKASLRKNHINTQDMCTVLEEELYRLLGTKKGERLPELRFYGDYSGSAHTSNSTLNDWEIIERHFSNLSSYVDVRIMPCRSVRDGVAATNARLKSGRGDVHIFIDPEAKHLIRDYELTVWDQAGMREDQNDPERSHAVSAVRYYVDREHPLRGMRVTWA
jgi:hypothetical protein